MQSYFLHCNFTLLYFLIVLGVFMSEILNVSGCDIIVPFVVMSYRTNIVICLR